MKLHQFIMENVPHDLVHDTDRKTLFSAYFATADDFFGGIVTLLQAGGAADGAAMALMRPVLDVAVRAQWVFFCASEENVTRIHAGDPVNVFPGFEAMMDALQKYVGEDLYRQWRDLLKTFHGFTHGGYEQLQRRFDAEGNLRSSYPEALKLGILNGASSQLALLASLFCKVHFKGLPQDDPKAKLIEAKYTELFPAPKAEIHSMSVAEHEIAGYKAVFEQAADGSWGGTVPDLPTILTNGRTLDEARENMKEAIALWVKVTTGH